MTFELGVINATIVCHMAVQYKAATVAKSAIIIYLLLLSTPKVCGQCNPADYCIFLLSSMVDKPLNSRRDEISVRCVFFYLSSNPSSAIDVGVSPDANVTHSKNVVPGVSALCACVIYISKFSLTKPHLSVPRFLVDKRSHGELQGEFKSNRVNFYSMIRLKYPFYSVYVASKISYS